MSRVLIVDDDLHVREVLRDFLTRVGDEVETSLSQYSPDGRYAMQTVYEAGQAGRTR